jgi:hypothetical protein
LLPFVKNESKYVGAGKEFFWNPNFRMVSITIDPEHDAQKYSGSQKSFGCEIG